MLSFLVLVILVVILMIIFYMQLFLIVGSVMFVVVWLLCGLLVFWLYNLIFLILLVGVLVVFNYFGLCCKLISKLVYQVFGKMMLLIGDIECEVIEVGVIWFEVELFSGKFDWDDFFKVNFIQFIEDEQLFLDNEVQELCEMFDEWKIYYEYKDLFEEVWDFLKIKGFFSLIIFKEYGGWDFSVYV